MAIRNVCSFGNAVRIFVCLDISPQDFREDREAREGPAGQSAADADPAEPPEPLSPEAFLIQAGVEVEEIEALGSIVREILAGKLVKPPLGGCSCWFASFLTGLDDRMDKETLAPYQLRHRMNRQCHRSKLVQSEPGKPTTPLASPAGCLQTAGLSPSAVSSTTYVQNCASKTHEWESNLLPGSLCETMPLSDLSVSCIAVSFVRGRRVR